MRRSMERSTLSETLQAALGEPELLPAMEKANSWFDKLKVKFPGEDAGAEGWFWLPKDPLLKHLKAANPSLGHAVAERVSLLKLISKASEIVCKEEQVNTEISANDREKMLKKINEFEKAREKLETPVVKKVKPPPVEKPPKEKKPPVEKPKREKKSQDSKEKDSKEKESKSKEKPPRLSKPSKEKKSKEKDPGMQEGQNGSEHSEGSLKATRAGVAQIQIRQFFAPKPDSQVDSKKDSQVVEDKPKSLWNILGSFDLNLRESVTQKIEEIVVMLANGKVPPRTKPTADDSIQSDSRVVINCRNGKSLTNSRIDSFFQAKRVNLPRYSAEELLADFHEEIQPLGFARRGPGFKFVRFEDEDGVKEWRGQQTKQAPARVALEPCAQLEDLVDYDLCSADELALLDADNCSNISEESGSSAGTELDDFLVPDENQPGDACRPKPEPPGELRPLLFDFHAFPAQATPFVALPVRPLPKLIPVAKPPKPKDPKPEEVDPQTIKALVISLCGLHAMKDALKKIATEFPHVPKRVVKHRVLCGLHKRHVVDPSKLNFEVSQELFANTLFQNLDLASGNSRELDRENWVRSLFFLLNGSSLSSAIKEEKIINPLLQAIPSLNRFTIEKKIKEITKSALVFDSNFCQEVGIDARDMAASVVRNLFAPPSQT